MPLTKSQLLLRDNLLRFVCTPATGLSPDKRTFLIKGYAGTGKTFSVCSIISEILSSPVYNQFLKKEDIRFCAPTNKAKKILKETVSPLLDFEKHQFRTLHQLLSLTRKVNEYGGNSFEASQDQFKKESIDPKKQFKFVVIDECSMIPQKLYGFIVSLMILRPYLKVVFLGDPCQLPPINEISSKTFDSRPDSELTEIVRNKGAIQSLCNYTRERQTADKPIDFLYWNTQVKPECENKEGVVFLSNEELWKETIFEAFQTIPDTHVLTWTNRRTDYLNREIRKNLFPDKYNEPYCTGERLIATDFFKGRFVSETAPDLVLDSPGHFTCDQFTVHEVTQENVFFSLCKPGTMEPPENFTLPVLKLVIYKDPPFFEYIYSAVTCQPLYDTILEKATSIAKERTELFKKFKTKAYKDAAKEAWGQVYGFKEKFMPGINYDYSTTVHKSQGSTYKLVFVDLADISRNRDLLYRNQCIYTAFSRASTRLIVYN